MADRKGVFAFRRFRRCKVNRKAGDALLLDAICNKKTPRGPEATRGARG
jgi:hypothetical protein